KTLGIYMLHMPVVMVMGYMGVAAEYYCEAISIPVIALIVLLFAYGIVSLLRLIPVINRLV
nr:hypothetical protein [Lachnospiraceae bacterium]